MTKEDITLQITLDEMHIPEKISWESSQTKENRDAKAILVSVWDKKDQSAYKIDLWTKEMTVDEMRQLYHQTFLTLSDSFERSTGDKKMADHMKDFATWFAEELKIKYKEEK